MSHKHHSCSCPHESVKFCSTCKLVHCEDCNQEWVTRTTNTWGYQCLGNTYTSGTRSLGSTSVPVTYTAATEPTNMTYSVQNSAPLTYQPSLDEMGKLKDAFCNHKAEKKVTK
jgi:hypothetical protein